MECYGWPTPPASSSCADVLVCSQFSVPRCSFAFRAPGSAFTTRPICWRPPLSAVGIAITLFMTRDATRVRDATPALQWIERYSGPSAMLAFVLCVELVAQFDELRKMASDVFKHL